MNAIQLGRLVLGPPSAAVAEVMGDPIANTGGAIMSAERAPLTISLQLNTILSGASTVAQAQTLRRQIRAALSNTHLKLEGHLYFVYQDDPEQNAWLIPDPTTFQSRDSTAFKIGLWESQSSNWSIAGRMRTHKEARRIWMKDLRTGLYERDAQLMVLSTDFAALPGLPLSVLPNGAVSPADTVFGGVIVTAALASGRDGGRCLLAVGLADLTVISYDRPESALNLSDVIVYDRRGSVGPFGGSAYDSAAGLANPQTAYGWEEVHGVDYPWSWMTGGTHDTPVVENGLVRVRYDGTNTPGFRVDVWNGSAYVEQGKMVVARGGVYDDTFIAAGLYTDTQNGGWTPERTVVHVVVAASTDAYSREEVFITVQRGDPTVTFEVYPGTLSSGAPADVTLQWTPALNSGVADSKQGIAKIDSQGTGSWTPGAAGTAVYAATAGLVPWGIPVSLGNANFTTSENWVAILRYPTAYNVVGAYQQTLVVLQAANVSCKYLGSSFTAYGTAANSFQIVSKNAAGYVQCQVAFAATQAQQILEAESMTLGAGTASTADAAASGGFAATATRTTDANAHVTQATWPNSFNGRYRVFLRVKVSAGTGSFYVKNGTATGVTVTTTSTAYVWLDMGDMTTDGSTLEIHAWISTGTGTVSVDRLEAPLTQDRVRVGAVYSGSRDLGQAALYDSRQLGVIVSR